MRRREAAAGGSTGRSESGKVGWAWKKNPYKGVRDGELKFGRF